MINHAFKLCIACNNTNDNTVIALCGSCILNDEYYYSMDSLVKAMRCVSEIAGHSISHVIYASAELGRI